MFRYLEGKYEPLAPLRIFFTRIGRCFLVTLVIIAFSLTIGTIGYHYSEGLGWLDSLLNAAMILTGMGPHDRMQTTSGKLFSTFYCLYSGLAFLSLVAIMIAPIYHRFLHRFHLDEDDLSHLPPPRAKTPPLGTDL
jgi:putative effector of murein hydrolase